jgi:hypothetical protein
MFVLQTTIAVLIAFLALTAYNQIQNALAKGRLSRQVDDEKGPLTPSPSADDGDAAEVADESPEGGKRRTAEPQESSADKQLGAFKQLYHKLHNLEYHPGVIPECREVLLSLLSETLFSAIKAPGGSILSIGTFSRDELGNFLRANDATVTDGWEAYLTRRKAGSPREVFSDLEEAKWWLKQAACVKYVDGAWLGHINKASTPFHLRKITKNAWQVMSEELGDGDLAKNHVHVYRKLMQDIHADLPDAGSADFISPQLGLNQLRCWKAAVAQLLISLFPDEFLPEALGFSMAYETLPLHLLKTVKELRELKLDPYYFELHISIDNADSGHAAMAMAAAADYVNMVAARHGPEAAEVAWRRVQAGFVLAEGLPTVPESPSLKRFLWTAEEASIIRVFAAKAPVAHKIHCNSRLRIGRHTLIEWLEPNQFSGEQWRRDFLDDLSCCRPWVVQGDSGRSRLVKELSWEGKMFGSFTQDEVEVVKAWIDSILPRERASANTYSDFIGQLAQGNRVVAAHFWPLPDTPAAATSPAQIGFAPLQVARLVPLWFASATLLENLPTIPSRVADQFGSAIVRVLRAQVGFNDEGPGVSGMDEVRRTDDGEAAGIIELGLQICFRAGLPTPGNLSDAIRLGDERGRQAARWMVALSQRWLASRDLLIGMSWAFMELHEALARSDAGASLLGTDPLALVRIAERERRGLEVCKEEIYLDPERRVRFMEGARTVRSLIQ